MGRAIHYVLAEDGKTPVPMDPMDPMDLRSMNFQLSMAWTQENKQLQRTTVGKRLISTVFLMIDHNYGSGAPILYESMVFGRSETAPDDDEAERCERYHTHEEALQGHMQILQEVVLQEPASRRVVRVDPRSQLAHVVVPVISYYQFQKTPDIEEWATLCGLLCPITNETTSSETCIHCLAVKHERR